MQNSCIPFCVFTAQSLCSKQNKTNSFMPSTGYLKLNINNKTKLVKMYTTNGQILVVTSEVFFLPCFVLLFVRFWFLETVFHSTAQTGLKLMEMLLPRPYKCGDHKNKPPYLGTTSLKKN